MADLIIHTKLILLTDSSISSTLKRRPLPRELDHSLMVDFEVTRAQIVHLMHNIS